jgi:hypothetical protein
MANMIFVNLPTSDLERAKAFHQALGFSINPQFTSEDAACVVIHDNIFAMILIEPYFQTFTPKPVADAHKATEVIVALAVDSVAEVDAMYEKAIAAGGKQHRERMDHGFMVQQAFADPDGHVWEVFWMDPGHVQ